MKKLRIILIILLPLAFMVFTYNSMVPTMPRSMAPLMVYSKFGLVDINKTEMSVYGPIYIKLTCQKDDESPFVVWISKRIEHSVKLDEGISADEALRTYEESTGNSDTFTDLVYIPKIAGESDAAFVVPSGVYWLVTHNGRDKYIDFYSGEILN